MKDLFLWCPVCCVQQLMKVFRDYQWCLQCTNCLEVFRLTNKTVTK